MQLLNRLLLLQSCHFATELALGEVRLNFNLRDSNSRLWEGCVLSILGGDTDDGIHAGTASVASKQCLAEERQATLHHTSCSFTCFNVKALQLLKALRKPKRQVARRVVTQDVAV